MGRTKDLWTKPARDENGKILKNEPRVRNDRWGKGRRWLAVWQGPEGKEDTLAFTKKVDADNYWRSQETDRERGDYRAPDAGKVILDTLAARYLAVIRANRDPNTYTKYEIAYRLHIKPTLGARQSKTIKTSEVNALLLTLSSTHGPRTSQTVLGVLQCCLDLAVDDKEIADNPARSKRIVRAKATPRKIVAWSGNRTSRIIAAHPDHLAAVPLVAATAGLRQCELAGLSEEDLDFDARVIWVRRQLKRVGPAYVFAHPKGGEERQVPMALATGLSLQLHLNRYPATPESLPWLHPGGDVETHNLIFRWRDGAHLKSAQYNDQVWKLALVAAEVILPPVRNPAGRLVYSSDRKHGIHQLRHYFASMMLAGGVSLRELQEYLGHASMKTTMEYYLHMVPDSRDRAHHALDQAFALGGTLGQSETEQRRNGTTQPTGDVLALSELFSRVTCVDAPFTTAA